MPRHAFRRVAVVLTLLTIGAVLSAMPTASAQDGPTVSITKSGLADQAFLKILVGGLPPGTAFSVWQCAPGESARQCTPVEKSRSNDRGKGKVQAFVNRELFDGDQRVDCASASCVLELRSSAGRDTTDLDFAGKQPLPEVAVGATTVTPGKPTPVSVNASVRTPVVQCTSDTRRARITFAQSRFPPKGCTTVGEVSDGTGSVVPLRALVRKGKTIDCAAEAGRCELRMYSFGAGTSLSFDKLDPLAPTVLKRSGDAAGGLPQFAPIQITALSPFAQLQMKQCIRQDGQKNLCVGAGRIGPRGERLDPSGAKQLDGSAVARRLIWKNGTALDCAAPASRCYLTSNEISQQIPLRFDGSAEPLLPELIVPEGPFRFGEEISVELRNVGPLTSVRFGLIPNERNRENRNFKGAVKVGSDGASGHAFATFTLTRGRSLNCGGPDAPCLIAARGTPGFGGVITVPVLILDD